MPNFQPVVGYVRFTGGSMTIKLGGRGATATLKSMFRLTLKCGHVVERPDAGSGDPPKKLKCPFGCGSAMAR